MLSAKAATEVSDANATNTDEDASAGAKGNRVVFTVVYSVIVGHNRSVTDDTGGRASYS